MIDMASISKDMGNGILGRKTITSKGWIGGMKNVVWVTVSVSWNSEDRDSGAAEKVSCVIL